MLTCNFMHILKEPAKGYEGCGELTDVRLLLNNYSCPMVHCT